ncbi:MAG: hypothetical protein C5B53_00325 [Candidatus Melainabacteria bacterium]|nr:MAG: hypothetical protein C5B53_00325 [Candidatus Melainabacteria bacterium]
MQCNRLEGVQMKRIITLGALACLIVGYSITSLPVWAKDEAADATKNETKAASEANKAAEETERGRTRRAGRDAKKATKDGQKAENDLNNAAAGQ